MPEAHTDFLLAVIAEVLGFAGVTMVVLLFTGWWRGPLPSGARRPAWGITSAALAALRRWHLARQAFRR